MHDVGCECCKDGEESIDHVLLRCTYAKEMWSFTGLRNTLPQCSNESNLSFVDVANQMINRLCKDRSWLRP